jgi:hypothetical protein
MEFVYGSNKCTPSLPVYSMQYCNSCSFDELECDELWDDYGLPVSCKDDSDSCSADKSECDEVRGDHGLSVPCKDDTSPPLNALHFQKNQVGGIFKLNTRDALNLGILFV